MTNTAVPHSSHRPMRRGTGSRPAEWCEAEIEIIREALDSGNLGMLKNMLSGGRVAHLLRIGGPEHRSAIEQIQCGLARRMIEEAEAGGPGSLIVAAHPFTQTLAKLGARLG